MGHFESTLLLETISETLLRSHLVKDIPDSLAGPARLFYFYYEGWASKGGCLAVGCGVLSKILCFNLLPSWKQFLYKHPCGARQTKNYLTSTISGNEAVILKRVARHFDQRTWSF